MFSKITCKCSKIINKLEISKKVLAIVFMVAFIISLVPIVVTAFYSVPVFDDYTFGYLSHKSVTEGGSLFIGAIEATKNFYLEWQGFYTSNFIAAFQLFNIDVGLYFISNLLIIFSVLFSVFYFSNVILKKVFGLGMADYILITVPVATLLIQFLPSLAEGFYWMDGSLSMLTQSIMLLIFSFVIQYKLACTKGKRAFYFILSVVFMLIISGTSILTYITMMLVFILALIYSFSKKYNTKSLIITLMLIYTVGIIISLIAPGNAVRIEQNGGTGYSLIMSIIYALISSVDCFSKWTTLSTIAVLLFISLVFYNIAQKSKFQFRNPLLVFVISYLIYAARMSIQFFSLGYLGAPRQMNNYYFGYIIMVTISTLYFVGWLSKKIKVSSNNVKQLSDADLHQKVIVLIFLLMFFVSGCFNVGVKNVASVSTSWSLLKGETQQYSVEMHERINLYENSDIKNVAVKPISKIPDCFMDEPLKSDPDYWTNRSVAKYYNKETVVLFDGETSGD